MTFVCLSNPTCVCMCVSLCYRPAFVTERLGISSKQINNYHLHRAHVSASNYNTWSHFLPVASPHLPRKDDSPVDDHVATQDSAERTARVIPPISNLDTISLRILPHGVLVTADCTSKQFNRWFVIGFQHVWSDVRNCSMHVTFRTDTFSGRHLLSTFTRQ